MRRTITKFSIFFFILVFCTPIFAQYREPMGRYHPEDRNIDLPSLDFTGKALIVGIILLILGWTISKITKKPNEEGSSAVGGWLMILGIICLVPGLAWLQTIVASLWIIGTGALIAFGILALIWDKLRSNFLKERSIKGNNVTVNIDKLSEFNENKAAPPKHLIQLERLENSLLKFDNMYIFQEEQYCHCLKFFKDGEVIGASIVGNIKSRNLVESVNNWFKKGYSNKGQYTIIGNRIDFVLTSEEGVLCTLELLKIEKLN